jgi:electron transfer flavoprotein alpha subunit
MKSVNNILVYIESSENGDLSLVSLEALNLAKLTCGQGGRISAMVVGENANQTADELKWHAIDAIYVKEDAGLTQYLPQSYVALLEDVYHRLSPDLILLGNTKNGSDLAARAALQFDIPLVMDCVKIEWDEEDLLFTKPVYSNNVMAVYARGESPCIVTLRPKSTDPSEKKDSQKGEIINLDSANFTGSEEYEVEEFVPKGDDGGLENARVIVSGGRGIGGEENFVELKELSDLIGAQLGATRPPCDLGWVSPDSQIGITGAIVSPQVYFAIGISGSFQHLAGMGSSRTIISVNPDPNANIFKISDYGIVGEYEEVLPGLIAGFQENQG